MTVPDGPIEAITFDFWNTLIAEDGTSQDHRSEHWVEALIDHGHDIDDAAMSAGMGELWRWYNIEWQARRVVTAEVAVTKLVEALGIEPTVPLVDTMLEVLHAGRDPEHMTVAAGIGDALETIRAGGVRVGIICDVGFTPAPTLRRYLAHYGLLGYFDAWSFSDEVGTYKPDPAIYAHARRSLDVSGAMAHIGDLRRTDIAGAHDVGWLALRYTGLNDDSSELPDGDVVIGHHREIAAALGL